MQEPAPTVTASRPELPASVDAVVARALAKDPGERFATCSSFLAALRAELEPGEAGASTVTLRLPPRRPSPVRPRRRRWGVLAAALLALAAALAGAAAGFLLAGGSDSEAATVTRAATMTTAVRDSAGSRLLAFVPESMRDECASARPLTPDFDETLICRPERGADVVRYSRAWSEQLLSGYFSRRAAAIAGVRRPQFGTRPRSSGSCARERLPALGEWRAFGRAGHDPGPFTVLGDPDGRVLCHRNSELATIEWTNSRLGIYARASGRDYPTLFEWWAYSAGPLH